VSVHAVRQLPDPTGLIDEFIVMPNNVHEFIIITDNNKVKNNIKTQCNVETQKLVRLLTNFASLQIQ